MSLLLQLLRVIFIATAMLNLYGCVFTSTPDIIGKNTKAFVGSVGFEKKVTKISAFELQYVGTFGKYSQAIDSSAIQINGTRFESPLSFKNRFSLQTLTANYRVDFLDYKILKLSIGPTVSLSFANIESEIDSVKYANSKTHPGIGLKLGASLALGKNLSLLGEYALYDKRTDDSLTSFGLSFAYDINANARVNVGAIGLSFSDGSFDNGDGCAGSTTGGTAITDDCKDSEFELFSRGVHIGVQYRK